MWDEAAAPIEPGVEGLGAGRKRLLSASAFVSANLLNHLVAAASGILIARWVIPADYGIWVALNLLPAYLVWTHAGSIDGLRRDLPVELGRGDASEARTLVGTATVAGISAGVAAAAGVLVIGLLFAPDHDLWAMGLGFMAFSAFATVVRLVLETIGRSYGRFRQIAFGLTLQAVASLAALLMVRAYGLKGLFFRTGIVVGIVLLVYALAFGRHLAWAFKWSAFRRLVVTGLPIFLAAYAALVIGIADRSLGSLFLSREELGIFGLAVFIYSAFAMVGNAIADMLLPEMAFEFGRAEDVRVMWDYVARHVRAVFLLMPVPLVAAWFSIPYFLERFIPAFTDAAGPARILLVGSILWSTTWMLGNFLITIGWAWRYAATLFAGTGLLWAVGYVALRMGYGTEGIAFANVVATASMCLAAFAIGRRAVRAFASPPPA